MCFKYLLLKDETILVLQTSKTLVQSALNCLLDEKGWSVEEAAEALGDSPLRLYRVLEGDEELGRTASLATLALKHNLEPIK